MVCSGGALHCKGKGKLAPNLCTMLLLLLSLVSPIGRKNALKKLNTKKIERGQRLEGKEVAADQVKK